MNIDNLEAGRETDVLVAETIMGWTNCDVKEDCEWWQNDKRNRWHKICIKYGMGEPPESKPGYRMRALIPPYSAVLTVARATITTVLDYLAQSGPRGGFRSGNVSLQKGAWIRRIYETDIHHGNWHCKFTQEYSGKQKRWWGSAADLPLAICRASLKVYDDIQGGYDEH